MAYGLLIRWYFQFTWVFGIHPISLGVNEATDEECWTVKSRLAHQIYCGVVIVLEIFAMLKKVRIGFYNPVDSPLVFFVATRSVLVVCVLVTHKLIGYFKHGQMREFLKFLEVSLPQFCPLEFPKWMVKLASVGLGTLSLVSALLYVVQNFVNTNATISQLMKLNAENGKWILFIINKKPQGIASFNERDEVSGDEMALAVFYLLILLVQYVHGFFAGYFLFVFVLSMWMATRGYCKYVKTFVQHKAETHISPTALIAINDLKVFRVTNKKGVRLVELNSRICEFKRFVMQCNEIISTFVLLQIAQIILVYTLTLDMLLQFRGYVALYLILYEVFLAIGVLWMSADIHKQINNLCTVITNEMDTCDKNLQEYYETLIHVTKRSKLGVSVWGCFSVTFSGLFQVVSATLTFYFLVVGKT